MKLKTGESVILKLQQKRDTLGSLHLYSHEADALIDYIKFLTDQLNKYDENINIIVEKLEKSESSLRKLLGDVNEINK